MTTANAGPRHTVRTSQSGKTLKDEARLMTLERPLILPFRILEPALIPQRALAVLYTRQLVKVRIVPVVQNLIQRVHLATGSAEGASWEKRFVRLVTRLADAGLEDEQERVETFEQFLVLVREDMLAVLVFGVKLGEWTEIVQTGEQIPNLLWILDQVI